MLPHEIRPGEKYTFIPDPTAQEFYISRYGNTVQVVIKFGSGMIEATDLMTDTLISVYARELIPLEA